jgi:uncharacterized protein (TIGR02186 family)
VRAAALLFLLLAAFPARAETLILTTSTEEVKINSNFTGTAITLFGAIDKEADAPPRAAGYDIVAVVRGPPETVVTRRKERLFGIWANRAAAIYRDVPVFYAVAANRPIDAIAPPETLNLLELGLAHVSTGPDGPVAGGTLFRDAFIRLKGEARLYSENAAGVTFPGANIFQATVELPANIPVGRYQVSVFLFSGGVWLTRDDEFVVVSKTGFEQLMFTLAHENAVVYGVACVLLALTIGWLAGVIFHRD